MQNKVNNADWHGWNFPGGHVEQGEYVTPSVIREMQEETGLTIENPKLCGIKEFHKLKDGKRYIVFLYVVNKFTGELKSSNEREIARSFTREPLMISRRYIVNYEVNYGRIYFDTTDERVRKSDR